MNQENKSTSRYWLYFFISLAGIILMLIFVRPFFWVVLPFVVTFFAKALNLMDDNKPEDQEVY